MTDLNNILVQVTFRYFNDLSPLCMNDIFVTSGQNTLATRTTLFKLSQPFKKSNNGQKCHSHLAPKTGISCQIL